MPYSISPKLNLYQKNIISDKFEYDGSLILKTVAKINR
jgi:hypothetical protein